MSTEIFYTIILIVASLTSAILMHFFDKNRDNKITKEEIEETIEEAFTKK